MRAPDTPKDRTGNARLGTATSPGRRHPNMHSDGYSSGFGFGSQEAWRGWCYWKPQELRSTMDKRSVAAWKAETQESGGESLLCFALRA